MSRFKENLALHNFLQVFVLYFGFRNRIHFFRMSRFVETNNFLYQKRRFFCQLLYRARMQMSSLLFVHIEVVVEVVVVVVVELVRVLY